MDLSVGFFVIVQVVGVGSAPGFKKINCHVFSQKIAKSVVSTLGFFKPKKFPLIFLPKKNRNKNFLSTRLKTLQKLKNSFSKSCLRKFQGDQRKISSSVQV